MRWVLCVAYLCLMRYAMWECQSPESKQANITDHMKACWSSRLTTCRYPELKVFGNHPITWNLGCMFLMYMIKCKRVVGMFTNRSQNGQWTTVWISDLNFSHKTHIRLQIFDELHQLLKTFIASLWNHHQLETLRIPKRAINMDSLWYCFVSSLMELFDKVY